MRVIAILHCSAGNDSVGEMWRETKMFQPDHQLKDVLAWAGKRVNCTPEELRKHLEITVEKD